MLLLTSSTTKQYSRLHSPYGFRLGLFFLVV